MTDEELKRDLLEHYPQTHLTPISERDVALLRTAHPGLPEDYVRFLVNVGHGSIGDGRFMVYNKPLEPSEIYDAQTADALAGIWLIGDNFGGYCVGFDSGSSWAFGGVDCNGVFAPIPGIGTFTEFVEDWFLSSQ